MRRSPPFAKAHSFPTLHRAARDVLPLGLPFVLLACLVALAQAVPLPAQSGLFSDDLTVRLIEVDVEVTDPRGTPAEGLEAEDFKLLVDGRPVEIRFFEALEPSPPSALSPPPADTPSKPADTSRPPGGAGPESDVLHLEPAPSRRRQLHLAVLLDRAYLLPGDAADLEHELQTYLDRLGPGDQVLLATADRGVRIVQGFRPPPLPVRPLFAENDRGLGRGQRIRLAYDEVLRSIGETIDPEAFDPLRGRHPHRETRMLMTRLNRLAEEAGDDVEVTVAQMRFLIAALAGLPGEKVVLYLGGRMPISAGQALHRAWSDTFGEVTGRIQAAASTRSDDLSLGLTPDAAYDFDRAPPLENPDRGGELFASVAVEASAQGVRFYTLDVSRRSAGFPGGGSYLSEATGRDWSFGETQRSGHLQAIGELAETSGGRTLGDRRDLSGFLAELERDLTSGYTLAFEPPAAEDPEADHEIEIRLADRSHRKLRLAYRRHVRGRTPDQEAADRTLSALLLADGRPALANPLALELVVEPIRPQGQGQGDGDGMLLPLVIRLPVAKVGLAAEEREHRGQLSLFITAGAAGRGAAPVQKAVVPIRLSNDDLPAAFSRRLEYRLEVPVPAGVETVAVSVRDDLAPTVVATVVARLPEAPAPLLPARTGDARDD